MEGGTWEDIGRREATGKRTRDRSVGVGSKVGQRVNMKKRGRLRIREGPLCVFAICWDDGIGGRRP